MAARRRSLLDRMKSPPSHPKDATAPPEEPAAPPSEPPPEAEAPPVEAEAPPVEAAAPPDDEAATTLSDEPTEPPDAPQVDVPAEPPPAPLPTDFVVNEPPPPPASDPEAVQVAAEPTYTDKSTGPVADTSPLGWGSSVHDASDPINDFFDTTTKAKTPTPTKATPAKDPPRPVSRDAGPAWADPIGVPGPPPLPGLSDRFTPPPAERRTPIGTDNRPAYLPTPPPAPPPDPRAGRRTEIPDRDPEITEPVPTPFGLPRPVFYILALLAAVALVVLIVLGTRTVMASFETTNVVSTPRPSPVPTVAAPVPGGLEVRSTLRNPMGATDTATPSAEAAPAPVAAPSPAPAAGPAPIAAPAPRPKPAPTVAPPPVVTRTGTLKVRSNRKVLVFVNGRAMGHAPLDLPLVPGEYTLSAALPSRPDTEQLKTVELSAGEIERVDFNY